LEPIYGTLVKPPKAVWYEVNLHTVQHTGTNFMMKILNDAGWKYINSYHWKRNRTRVPESRFTEDFVISTIRNPRDVYITWVSRQRKEDFLELWQLFNRAFENNQNLHIVPVDIPSGRIYLQRLSKKLHCDLITDWKPVGSEPHKDNIEIPDLSAIYDLPVVKHFYGDSYESKRI